MNSEYTINGKTYNSLDEIPEDCRKKFQELSSVFLDSDGNELPYLSDGKLIVFEIFDEFHSRKESFKRNLHNTN